MVSILSNLWQAVGPHAANIAALIIVGSVWLQVAEHDRDLGDVVDDVHEIELTIAKLDREQAVRGQRLVEIATKLQDVRHEQERVRDLIIEIIRESPSSDEIVDSAKIDRKGPFRRLLQGREAD